MYYAEKNAGKTAKTTPNTKARKAGETAKERKVAEAVRWEKAV